MLIHTTKPRAQRGISKNLYTSYQQLLLPWLCPAFHGLSPHPPRRRLATVPRTSANRSAKPKGPITTQVRHQASSAEASVQSNDDTVPFVDLTPNQQTYQRTQDIEKPRDYDRSNIVVLRNQAHTALPVFKKVGLTGISGDVSDIVSNLHACARVGRHERAAKLVKRLASMYESWAPELVDAHRVYLSGQLETLEKDKSKDTISQIQRWFELEIRAKEVPPTPAILALMLKAIFIGVVEKRRDRLLRRYLAVVDAVAGDLKTPEAQDNYKSEVFASSLFTQEEYTHLVSLLPEYGLSPSTVEEGETKPEEPQTPWHTVDLSNYEESEEVTLGARQERKDLPLIVKAEQGEKSLYFLKHSLSSLYGLGEEWETSGFSLQALNKIREERLERDVREAAIQRWEMEAQNLAAQRARGVKMDSTLGPYMHDWMKSMAKSIEAEKQKSAAVETQSQFTEEESGLLMIGPVLGLAKAEKLAAAALMAFIDQIAVNQSQGRQEIRGNDSKPAKRVFQAIGEAVGIELRLEDVKAGFQKKYKALPTQSRRQLLRRVLQRPLQKPEADSSSDASNEMKVIDANNSLLDEEDPIMIASTTIQIGAWFLNLILKTAKLPVTIKDPTTGVFHTELQPAASHGSSYVKGRRLGHVRANAELIRRLQTELIGGFISKPLPMLCEPVAWTSLKKGAYLRKDPASASIMAVRTRDSSKSQLSHLDEADRQGHMERLYHGLNVLSRVPWRVNRPLLKVLIDAWNTGERLGKLAPADAETYVNDREGGPLPPADTTDRAAFYHWNQLNQLRRNEIQSFRSQRAYQNFQLEVARAYADEDAFYTPHNVDFRGRAYPIPPYFNHMGADHVRALFTFAKGKELGSAGLRWLKIQVANQYGFDKEKLEDRVEFAERHLAEIYDSVEQPLDGKRWWLTAGHPWQCLAACIELKAALDSPVPEKYISRLPVQQDGTCNGLQHYAALGGDKIGAAQVNLLPGEKPADIYSAVKDLVVQDVHTDAENGNFIAQILDGRITRKVVKQPVMTNVYGVTYHGAKEQVRKQLLDIIPKTVLGSATYGALSAYVARHIFGALGRMFSGAQAIQLWLGDCGARISQSVNPDQIASIMSKRAAEREAAAKAEAVAVAEAAAEAEAAAAAAAVAAAESVVDDGTAKKKKKGSPRTKKRKDVKAINNSAKFKRPLLADTRRDYDQEDFQFKAPIIWTTPLGMPVVQPYRASKTKMIRSTLQRITYEEPSLSDPVSKRKQLQAFPPNFIHSLDSSHMMLSAIRSHGKGLTFSSVHDSFWTHASDVPVMNTILRDAFIEMHSEDIIGRLREEMEKRYEGFLYSAPIPKHSDLGRRIGKLRESLGRRGRWTEDPKVTDQKQIDELIEEYERQRLLRSEDPAERAKGAEMMTPARLWEEAEESEKVTLPVLDEKDIQLLGSQDDHSANAQNEREEAGLSADAEDAEVPGSEGAESLAEGGESDVLAADDGRETELGADAAKEADKDEATVDNLEANGDGEGVKKKKKSKGQSSQRARTHIWLPLHFKETPEKGDFDVAELKKSVYFFS